MTTPAERRDVDDVLQHLDWVRALALRLLGDPAEADDVRQDVWLLTRRIGAPGSGLRAWLGGVVRNVVRERQRARAIRGRHESEAAVAEARSRDRAHGDAALLQEVALQQVVVQRLMVLPEHYRSALLGRYYEQLSPEELARRAGVPVATIKTRLRRGLELLRGSLEREERGGMSAIAALGLALGRPVRPLAEAEVAAGVSAGPVAVGFALLAGAAAIAVAVTLTRRSGSEPAPGVRVEEALARKSAESRARLEEAPERGREARLPSAPSSAPSRAPSGAALDSDGGVAGAVPAASWSIAVVDVFGRPAPDLPVGLSTAEGEVRRVTDANGLCLFERPGSAWRLTADGPKHVTVGDPRPDVAFDGQAILVVAERLRLAGRVLDPSGAPVPRARIVVGLSAEYQSRLGRPLEMLQFRSFAAVSDAGGAFTLDAPWDGSALALRIERVGFRVALSELREVDLELEPAGAPRQARALPVRLQPLDDPGATFGRVIDGNGQPLEGAFVSDGGDFVATDAFGEFQLGTARGSAPLGALTAVARGRVPVALERVPGGAPYTLTLAEPALALSGTVRDPSGAPAAGVIVQPLDPTPFGATHFVHLGRDARAELSLETLADPRGAPLARPFGAVTDDAGRFELGGLAARSYELEVFDPRTLARAPARAWEAGTQQIELAAPARPRPLSGRVTDLEGRPLAGISVQALERPARMRGAVASPAAATGADGAFRFAALARDGVALAPEVASGWLAPRGIGVLTPGVDDVALVLSPAARVTVVVSLRERGIDPARSLALHFEDERGAHVEHAGGDVVDDLRTESPLPTPRADGRAHPLPMWVPTTAAVLVLTQDGVDVIRLPITLRQGAELSFEL